MLPYSEDQAWAIATITSGGWIAYQPSASVYHSHNDSYHRYYRLVYEQFRIENYLGPKQDPPLGRRQCLRITASFVKSYVGQCVRYGSLNGLHWDLFRVRLVTLFALYNAGKDGWVA